MVIWNIFVSLTEHKKGVLCEHYCTWYSLKETILAEIERLVLLKTMGTTATISVITTTQDQSRMIFVSVVCIDEVWQQLCLLLSNCIFSILFVVFVSIHNEQI